MIERLMGESAKRCPLTVDPQNTLPYRLKPQCLETFLPTDVSSKIQILHFQKLRWDSIPVFEKIFRDCCINA